MKFFRNLIILGIVGAMFTACGDEPEVTTPLELSKSELNFSKTAQSQVVTITTSESWTAETPVDWLLVSPLAGNGTGAVTISVTENDQTTARVSYVKITTKSDAKVLVVVQSADENDTEGNVTIENGAIQAPFSVFVDKQVYFSQGNLQYQAITGTWRFAEHQYDMIGNNNANISSSYAGWIDLFGWGTSGYNGKNPYMTSRSSSDYVDGSNDIAGTNYDWGVYNKISNGGNQAGQWRTLTKNEWDYLIFGRAQASRLMGQGRVNNVNGLILLPDGWETPSSVKFTYDPSGYSINVYSLDEWAVMESYGAVFLPAAGDRLGTDVYDVGSRSFYWSSSASYVNGDAYCLYFYSDYENTNYSSHDVGQSVRLVRGL